jgi:predicted RecB family nuclease
VVPTTLPLLSRGYVKLHRHITREAPRRLAQCPPSVIHRLESKVPAAYNDRVFVRSANSGAQELPSPRLADAVDHDQPAPSSMNNQKGQAELRPTGEGHLWKDTLMKITNEVLEGYLNCETKGHLKLAGEHGTPVDSEEMTTAASQALRETALSKLLLRFGRGDTSRRIVIAAETLKQGTPLLADAMFENDAMSIRFDALKRTDGTSKLGEHHYVPVLHFPVDKVGQQQKLMLAVLGLVLDRVQGLRSAIGLIARGSEGRLGKVRLDAKLYCQAEKVLDELTRLQARDEPPRLALNKHCQVCEFRQRCRAQAEKADDISLLGGLGKKELMRYNRKGIFTLTQLACTFRPRKKSKRSAQRMTRQHALHAMAIRDRKIYFFGSPDLPDSPVQVYLDLEGLPDEGFVYLIGMVVVHNNTVTQFSFWAEGKNQESDIFQQFLAEVTRHDSFAVFSYGSYERAFLKRMRAVAGDPKQVDRVLGSLVNVLSLVHAHAYFPCYSSGLKDVARCLGFSWTDAEASGRLSIAWRARRETTQAEEWKQKLVTYNLEDCNALRRVTDLLREVNAQRASAPTGGNIAAGGQQVSLVEEVERWDNNRQWGTARFAQPEFEQINCRAYFDYQRERVYVRTNTALRKGARKRKKNRRQKFRVTSRVVVTSKRCPECKGTTLTTVHDRKESGHCSPRAKRAYDLILTPAGVRRKVIECRASVHRCLDCDVCFIPETYKRLDKHFHGLKSWAMYQHVVHRISLQSVSDMVEEMFGVRVHLCEVTMLKGLMARYYRLAHDRLLQKILAGPLLHVDETEVGLRKGKGYVWVFTNLEEVVYLFRPTREGDFLKEMLKEFRGVLVSDFYAAYDSIDCPQQKCLIHLMRDMNQDLLNAPFDEHVKAITRPFGAILRSVVATIDGHGLKRRHLMKHADEVQEFFRRLSEQSFHSETAEALRQRLVKYKDKLFTFIEHDGVPWNNNNAEHAIKAFARYREYAEGSISEKGLGNHLVLLSLYQSCEYKGVSFLRFLKSGMRDLDAFREQAKPGRGQGLPAIQLYPKGFTPPHILRQIKKKQAGKDAKGGQDAIKQAQPEPELPK